MKGIREQLAPLALTILRAYTGIVMAVHGYQKFQNLDATIGVFTQLGMPMPDKLVWLAIAGEFLGGLGLIVGLLTPLAAFGVFATMFVAVSQVHFKNGLLSSNNGYEYPMTLMWIAFFFIMNGAGKYSLDALFCKKKQSGIEI
ncbi:DoxX family protein [bacterium]|nr:DoxX family protein [bacterium]